MRSAQPVANIVQCGPAYDKLLMVQNLRDQTTIDLVSI